MLNLRELCCLVLFHLSLARPGCSAPTPTPEPRACCLSLVQLSVVCCQLSAARCLASFFCVLYFGERESILRHLPRVAIDLNIFDTWSWIIANINHGRTAAMASMCVRLPPSHSFRLLFLSPSLALVIAHSSACLIIQPISGI